MGFKELSLNRKYQSVGENKISDVVNLLLKESIYYKRSVGFFSSSAFEFITEGLNNLIKNRGKVFLITSPRLSEEDIQAISFGYKTKKDTLFNGFSYDFEEALKELNDENLIFVSKLIACDILNIKIVSKSDYGIYHDKVAIFCDSYNDKVVITGSNNETKSGYSLNYETARVYKSWTHEDDVFDEEKQFDSIWNGEDEFLETYEFDVAYKNKLLEIIENETISRKTKKDKYVLFDYQKEAINAWINNNYKGFYVMATGTGKTVTSIYSLKYLLEKENVLTVITVPYKHLISQWYDDVVDILPDSMIIKVSSEFHDWDINIQSAIRLNRYGSKKNIIIISTISSFYSERFNSAIRKNELKKLLIVDEAHNFLNKIYDNKYDLNYDFRLGLSATPVFGHDNKKTEDLCNFFGGIVYNLPIEKAIGKFLVNYIYKPIFVCSTDNDEIKFNQAKRKMIACIDQKTGKIKDQEGYTKAHRLKLRSISMAENKLNCIEEFIDSIETPDHFIVYCSDGIVSDKRHLESVVEILNNKGFMPSKFTCEENMAQRISLIDNFNRGYISTLVAIRCLDEGINIPSIKKALILSSNDNYREFVQRRGRILRKFKGKELAEIIDVIVLPSHNCIDIAKIELRRFYEYAKLAINSEDLLTQLDEYLYEYSLNLEDIQFDYDWLNNQEDDIYE